LNIKAIFNILCKLNLFLHDISFVHEKNDFAERFKILLNTDLKIILLDCQNNFVGTLKIMSNAAKNFDVLATSLSVVHNYFNSSTKLLICIQPKF